MEGREKYELNRGALFVDLVNFRHILDAYRRHGVDELLDDVFTWVADPEHLGIDCVACYYLFGTYDNPRHPRYDELRLRRERRLELRSQLRHQNFSREESYDWVDIERRVRASSGEWDVAVLLGSSHHAFELAHRIIHDQIPGLRGKYAIVLYSRLSASRLYSAGHGDYDGVALEDMFPSWNSVYTTILQPAVC